MLRISFNVSRLRLVAASLALFLLTAVPAMAQLVRSPDSPHIYWVDRFGIRHHVASPDVQREFFGTTGTRNVETISYGSLLDLPLGGPLTVETPPELYDSRRDRWAQYERPARVYSRSSRYGGYEPRRTRRSYRYYER